MVGWRRGWALAGSGQGRWVGRRAALRRAFGEHRTLGPRQRRGGAGRRRGSAAAARGGAAAGRRRGSAANPAQRQAAARQRHGSGAAGGSAGSGTAAARGAVPGCRRRRRGGTTARRHHDAVSALGRTEYPETALPGGPHPDAARQRSKSGGAAGGGGQRHGSAAKPAQRRAAARQRHGNPAKPVRRRAAARATARQRPAARCRVAGRRQRGGTTARRGRHHRATAPPCGEPPQAHRASGNSTPRRHPPGRGAATQQIRRDGARQHSNGTAAPARPPRDAGAAAAWACGRPAARYAPGASREPLSFGASSAPPAPACAVFATVPRARPPAGGRPSPPRTPGWPRSRRTVLA